MTLSQRIQTASADETTPEQIAGQLTEAQRAEPDRPFWKPAWVERELDRKWKSNG